MVSNPAVCKKDMQKEHPVYTKPCMMHSKEKFLFLHFILQHKQFLVQKSALFINVFR